MRRRRWLLYGFVLAASVGLAYLLRDVVYDLVIVPAAYLAWLAQLLYLAIPQMARWLVLVVLLCIGILWKLVPDMPPAPRPPTRRRPAEGQIEPLAMSMLRAGRSNYFKWQLANRLARLARRIPDGLAPPEGSMGANQPVRDYLAAGMQSFVDFPTPRNRFQRPKPTPLDLDPAEVLDYLESRMELAHDRHR